MHHGTELAVVVILCATLAAGAAARSLAKRTRFPYTVLMLGLGLLVGVLLRTYEPEQLVLRALSHPVSTDLILFVFLPALVFESAFALDVHAFRKNIGFVSVLAAPALLVATGLTAAWMFGLTRIGGEGAFEWSLVAALVFGALISATDPVAVVALLREVGAPKRLGLLIEGESLLNDGTAIVVFGVLFEMLRSGSVSVDPGAIAFDFLRVVLGGIAVGTLLGWIASRWIGRTFEDPMVEITLTLVLAYSAMAIAEALLHVSGVLAIVTAGLMMAGPGKTRISPRVQHFLHEFWEMLAYIANTVVFFLVGVVITTHLHRAPLGDLAVVLGAFLGVVLIRFVVTFLFRPVGNLVVSSKVGNKEAVVMSWGGLRGAVSLALALMVSQTGSVDEALRSQILEVTAGVVMLTIVVNGTTTGWLLRKLGLTRVTPAEALDSARARGEVLEEVRSKLRLATEELGLRALPWDEVKEEIEAQQRRTEEEIEAAKRALMEGGQGDRTESLWRRAVAVERSCYASSFHAGTLGADALAILEHELDLHLDRVEAGELEPPPRVQAASWLRRASDRVARSLGLPFGRLAFSRLALRYDLSRAIAHASEKVRASLPVDPVDPLAVSSIDAAYAAYGRHARHAVEDLRLNLPEVASAIEARLAKRIALKLELTGYEALLKRGSLDPASAARAEEAANTRLKRLYFSDTKVALREAAELCRNAPLFADLDEEGFEDLAKITEEQAYAQGEWLFREGDRYDGSFLIAAGLVEVIREGDKGEEILATLGRGDIVGEMSLLSEERRNAGARAATSVSVGRIARKDFRALLERRPELADKIWEAYGERLLDNALRDDSTFAKLGPEARASLIGDSTVRTLVDGEALDRDGGGLALVLSGEVEGEGGTRSGRALFAPSAADRAKGPVRIIQLPTGGLRAARP